MFSVQQVGGAARAAGVVVNSGAQRKGQRAFTDAVGTEVIDDRLPAQVIHFGAHALKETKLAITAGPGGIGREGLRTEKSYCCVHTLRFSIFSPPVWPMTPIRPLHFTRLVFIR